MPSLPQLRQARSELKLDDLVSNKLLRTIAAHEGVISSELEVVGALKAAGATASPDEVSDLVRIVLSLSQPKLTPEATKPAAAENLTEPASNQSSPMPSASLLLDEEDSIGTALTDEQIDEDQEHENIDANDYLLVDVLGGADDESLQTLSISDDPSGGRLVSWKKSKTKGAVYVLVSGNGDFPRVISGSQGRFTTKSLKRRVAKKHETFSLFVFSKPGEKGRLLAQGRVLGEVAITEVQAYEDQVRLRWDTSDQVSSVKLYRSKPDSPLPDHPTAAMLLDVPDGASSFIDTDVQQGQEFEYKVILEWLGPDGKIIASSGDSKKVVIPGNISNVTGFVVNRTSSTSTHVDIEFDAVSRGLVKIFQIKGPPQQQLLGARASGNDYPVDRLSDSDVQSWLGTEVIDLAKTADGKVKIKKVPMLVGGLDARTYTAVGVLGKNARVCEVKVIQQVGEIDTAVVIDRFDYQLLRVGLPQGAQSLEVWLKSPNTVDQNSSSFTPEELGPPDRTVQIDEEYRRFGGVVFAGGVPGISNVNSLNADPLSIFVRGISSFEGESHPGPIYRAEYPGHVALRFRKAGGSVRQETSPAKGFGLFKSAKSQSPAPAKASALEICAETPSHLVGTTLDLEHNAAKEFPLDAGSEGALKKPFISIIPVQYKNWATPAISQNGVQGPVLLEPDYRFRITSATANVADVPVFCVDETVSSFASTSIKSLTANTELSIVLVGAKQSGKTTYVQALLNYLEQQLSNAMDAKLIPQDSADSLAKTRLNEMHKFVRTGVLPPATRSARQFMNTPPESEPDPADPTKPIKLKFYNGGNLAVSKISLLDVAGEDMDSLETMKYYEQQLVSADLIIFLMDPLQLKTVRVALSGSPLPPEGTDPFHVMGNLVNILQNAGTARNPRQKIAVTLSKFDSFEKVSTSAGSPIFGTIRKGMQITRDPNANSGNVYNVVDGNLVQDEILAILGRLSVAPFANLVKNSFDPSAWKFFVVSSLGHATHASTMDSAGITSFRVSDPIRWTLGGLLGNQSR